jgi:apolipoprotein N-acyltransferase
MAKLHLRLLSITGKSQSLVLILFGVLAATAFPPVHWVVFLVPAFVVLFWLVDAAPTFRRALWVGWLFGIGHFAAGFYWVGHAFMVDPMRYGWMAPFAVLGLAMGLALFSGFVALASKYLFKQINLNAYGRAAIFAVIWISVEWLRGWVLTGFPWNQIGTAWANTDIIMQFASVAGVLGLGLVTMLVALLPAGLVYRNEPKNQNFKFLPIVGFVLLICVSGFGGFRLSNAEQSVMETVKLRLVQPNIPQHLKWKPNLRLGHVRSLVRLSVQPSKVGAAPSHIIWPETAVPYDLQNDPNLLSALGKITPPDGALITGAPRSSGSKSQVSQHWNSLLVLQSGGAVTAIYDKMHLVPFGEYVPWRSVLRLTKLTAGRTDFSVGETPRTINISGLPAFAPLICYEAIFSNEVRSIRVHPRWLLNITNDAWFGQSSAPYQHFAAVRFRAVEMGLPLARVANTGISAMIDPYGRVVAQLALGRQGVLDVSLPKPLKNQTIYRRFGDSIVVILMIIIAGLSSVVTRIK